MAMTDEEKRAEIERVTKISGFRVMAHELLAEIDQQLGTSFLKARNDTWEKEHGTMTCQERMEEELQRAMCSGASPGKAPEHIAIHIHGPSVWRFQGVPFESHDEGSSMGRQSRGQPNSCRGLAHNFHARLPFGIPHADRRVNKRFRSL